MAARACAWSRPASVRAARTTATSRAPITAGKNSCPISTRLWRSCHEAGVALSSVARGAALAARVPDHRDSGRGLPRDRADGEYRSGEEARADVPYVVRYGDCGA